MKRMDPLSTKEYLKKSSESYNPLENAIRVKFSVLNRAENFILIGVNGSKFHPYWRQWLQNSIPIGVNGSRVLSLSVSMAPVGSKLAGSSQEPLPYPGLAIWSH